MEKVRWKKLKEKVKISIERDDAVKESEKVREMCIPVQIIVWVFWSRRKDWKSERVSRSW